MPSDFEPELSDVGDDDEEEEEPEEEEEEPEEEEEEEPEEEEEDNVEEKSVDSPSPVLEANNDDSSQAVESEGHDEDLSLENSQASPVADANDTSGGSCGSLDPSNNLLETQVMELSHVGDGGSKTQALRKKLLSSKDIEESFSYKKVIGSQPQKTMDIECTDIQNDHETHCGYQDHLCSSISSGADRTKSSCADKKEVEAETLMRDSVDKVSKSNLLLKEDTKKLDMQSEEVIKLKASRSITPQVRPRSLSPVAESDDGNKKPATICDFFVRGWCIKGSSCKFLHQKDSVASTSKRARQGAPAACSEDNLKKDEGWRVENRGPFVLSEPLASLDVNGPSLKSNLPSERIRMGEYGESQRPYQFLDQHDMNSSPVAQGDLRYGSAGNAWPHKVAASGSQFKSFAGDENIRSSAMSNLMDYKRSTSEEFNRRYPSSFKNIVPEHRGLSSGSVPESGMYLNSSYSFAHDNRIVEPPSTKLESRSMPYGSHSSPGFFSLMNSSFDTSLPSTGISPFHQTFPWSGAPPQHSCPLGPVQPDHAHHASGSSFLLRHSSSPYYSRPDQENFSLCGVPGDSLTSTGHVRQPSINNWEPSVPFRPSFHLPSFMSSHRSQYNPLRGSIDPPNRGDGAFQEPSVSQGATIHNIPKQRENRDFSSFHRLPYYSALHRDSSADAIGTQTDLAEGSGSFVAEQQNKSSLSIEEKSLIPGHIVNTSSAMEVELDHSLNHQADSGKHNRESKTLKIFRAALVEFVKELVKPHWREGHLSKDAHNTVVKKTVEKVLSTLQTNQIPNTAELIANYFKLFQPKLAKLVEAYVGKYAKSLQPV